MMELVDIGFHVTLEKWSGPNSKLTSLFRFNFPNANEFGSNVSGSVLFFKNVDIHSSSWCVHGGVNM